MKMCEPDRSTAQSHHPIDAFNALSRLHSFGVNPVGARQSQHARKLNTPTKEGNQLRNDKDEPEDSVENGGELENK